MSNRVTHIADTGGHLYAKSIEMRTGVELIMHHQGRILLFENNSAYELILAFEIGVHGPLTYTGARGDFTHAGCAESFISKTGGGSSNELMVGCSVL
jgi:hypothetical protein